MLTIIFLVFSHRFGGNIEHFGIYVLIGIIHYTHFANTTGRSMQVLYSMRKLTTDTIFPKEILVIGSVFSNAFEFILSMLVGVVIAILVGIEISWTIILLPFIIILQMLLVVWISLILSCLFVFIRDIGHIYQVFLRALFFITPIFYTISFLGDGIAKKIVMLNPLTHLVEFSRKLIIDGDPISIKTYILLVLINLILIQVCLKIFKQFEPAFAENV